MPVDILVFGPHPDDAEIGAGGLLLKMKSLGHRTGIVDMTTGDMGWGTPESRLRECEEAARILKLDVRENLDLGDCRVEDTFENRCKVAGLLRRHQPQIIMAPYYDLPIGRGLGHNDHYKTGQIVSNAFNLAHLRKAPVDGEPFQAKAIYYYFIPPGTRPTFVVDISPFFEDWIRALDCHQTQFHNPEKPRADHLPSVRDVFESYARYWGWQIGVKYGQAFLATGPLSVGDPMTLVREVVARL
ncbi:MAG: bacillithiol biosynthesis deacetylase BshB1 [Candidatus Eisenbacteria bacterium]|uniref:Bacillithiol biosynthesis deacetylase BshB1 n=1 Tax=Eiseniibacteriota bacterium TaxID=2212470 RepID=A0A849SQR3_UNCEI|nr:bacillithiol biosynthesis deacetylase BshB1 [Candidatus Eisenbacteria bacterium]